MCNILILSAICCCCCSIQVVSAATRPDDAMYFDPVTGCIPFPNYKDYLLPGVSSCWSTGETMSEDIPGYQNCLAETRCNSVFKLRSAFLRALRNRCQPRRVIPKHIRLLLNKYVETKYPIVYYRPGCRASRDLINKRVCDLEFDSFVLDTDRYYFAVPAVDGRTFFGMYDTLAINPRTNRYNRMQLTYVEFVSNLVASAAFLKFGAFKPSQQFNMIRSELCWNKGILSNGQAMNQAMQFAQVVASDILIEQSTVQEFYTIPPDTRDEYDEWYSFNHFDWVEYYDHHDDYGDQDASIELLSFRSDLGYAEFEYKAEPFGQHFKFLPNGCVMLAERRWLGVRIPSCLARGLRYQDGVCPNSTRTPSVYMSDGNIRMTLSIDTTCKDVFQVDSANHLRWKGALGGNKFRKGYRFSIHTVSMASYHHYDDSSSFNYHYWPSCQASCAGLCNRQFAFTYANGRGRFRKVLVRDGNPDEVRREVSLAVNYTLKDNGERRRLAVTDISTSRRRLC